MSSESALSIGFQGFLVPAALSHEVAELNREGGDAAGSLAKTQKTLRGPLSPDRVIENLPHFFGEGGIV